MFDHAVEVPVRYLIGLAQGSAWVIGVIQYSQGTLDRLDKGLAQGLVQGLAYLAYLAQSLAHLVRV